MPINIRYWATREITASGKKLKFITLDYKIVIASKNSSSRITVVTYIIRKLRKNYI